MPLNNLCCWLKFQSLNVISQGTSVSFLVEQLTMRILFINFNIGASTPRRGNSFQVPHRQLQTGTGKEKHQNNSQAPHCRSPRRPHPPSGPRHHPARPLPRALRCSESEFRPHQQRRCRRRRIPPYDRAVPAAGTRPICG